MVGGEGWTCLEAKKVLGYEIGGMRVGGGRLEMVGAEKGGRIRGLEKKELEIISGNKVGGRRVGSGWGGGLDMLGGQKSFRLWDRRNEGWRGTVGDGWSRKGWDHKRVGEERTRNYFRKEGWRKEGWKWLGGRVGHAWRLKKF